MPSMFARRRPLVVLAAAIVLAVVGFWAVSGRSGMDAEREQAARTSIEGYLEQHPWGGALAVQRSSARWFCASRVIEVDQGDEETEVGLHALCQEFAAEHGELLTSSASSGAHLATVTSPPRPVEVLRVESPPDGAGNAPWIRDHFSWYGVKKVHRAQAESFDELENTNITKARNAFGLPADAPVRRPS